MTEKLFMHGAILACPVILSGIYKLFTDEYVEGSRQFHIYACGRVSSDEGRHTLSSLMLGIVQCETDECRNMKKTFIASVQYHQLRVEKHYKKLGK